MAIQSKTIVFVHGAWMTSGCWDDFRKPFEAAGYSCHAPAWPTLDSGTAAELRANPPKALGGMSLKTITDSYAAFIKTLPEKPIVIGHSFGGLFVQLLVDRGITAGGVGISPGPIAGVIAGPQSLAGAAPLIFRWNGWNRPYTLPWKSFVANFANGAPAELQKREYDRLVVPTPGKIFHQAALNIGNKVDVKGRTVPLLITAAERDRTVTPFVAKQIYNIQKKAPGRTDYMVFKDHSHMLLGEPGWEKVAADVLVWIKEA